MEPPEDDPEKMRELVSIGDLREERDKKKQVEAAVTAVSFSVEC